MSYNRNQLKKRRDGASESCVYYDLQERKIDKVNIENKAKNVRQKQVDISQTSSSQNDEKDQFSMGSESYEEQMIL